MKGRAGLGNRVLALLSAILYARLSHRRLLADWSDSAYSSDGSNVIHHLFTGPDLDPAAEIPDTDSVRPALWRRHLRDTARDVTLRYAPSLRGDPAIPKWLSADLSRLDHQESVLVFWSFLPQIGRLRRHFTGELAEFRNLGTDAILRCLLRDALHVHPAILARAVELRGAWPQGPVIGVHVRYTDRKASLGATRRALDGLRAEHPEAALFLATDNAEVERGFRSAYPGLLTAPKWHSPSGAPLHTDPQRPDAAESAVEALTDICLLASCDYLVVDTGSTFAHLAVLLTGIPPGHVRDVRTLDFLPAGLRHALWLVLTTIRWAPRRLRAALAR